MQEGARKRAWQAEGLAQHGMLTPFAGVAQAVSPARLDSAASHLFRPNAGPSNPYMSIQGVISPTPLPSPVAPAPLFVGLTPGQVGLYQINVKIPDNVSPVVPCSGSLGVQSNLTIDIGGISSFDEAAICVQPPQ